MTLSMTYWTTDLKTRLRKEARVASEIKNELAKNPYTAECLRLVINMEIENKVLRELADAAYQYRQFDCTATLDELDRLLGEWHKPRGTNGE